jgi:hypothetical protein
MSTSFFNELETENELCSKCFSFFNELETENETMLEVSASFFNELETENETVLGVGFIF